jgi:hypothetical protein
MCQSAPAQPARRLHAYAFVRVPDQLRIEGEQAMADWHVTLPPLVSVTLDYAAAVATDAPTAAAFATRWAKAFDQDFQQAKTRWEQRWQAVFVPGNKHFSGHLPTLVTSDAKRGVAVHRLSLDRCRIGWV